MPDIHEDFDDVVEALMPESLYNTQVRVVAQIRASTPEEAHKKLSSIVIITDDAELLQMDNDDVFVSEADPEFGWDGERFDE